MRLGAFWRASEALDWPVYGIPCFLGLSQGISGFNVPNVCWEGVFRGLERPLLDRFWE